MRTTHQKWLATKLAMQSQFTPVANYAEIQAQERPVALQAAEQSLVLLKNAQDVVPLYNAAAIRNVVFVGDTNDAGLQNGGWSVNWQGQKNDHDTYFSGPDRVSSGTVTVEEGIRAQLGPSVNYYNVNATENNLPASGLTSDDTLVISVVAEAPYAEYMGDIANPQAADPWYQYVGGPYNYNFYLGMPQASTLNLQYSDLEQQTISALRSAGIKTITVVYSGRPMIISDPTGTDPSFPLNNSDVVIAAFLPGSTGGQAVTNAVFGTYRFGATVTPLGRSNALTFPWPADMTQVENHFSTGSPLFPVGYGLTTAR